MELSLELVENHVRKLFNNYFNPALIYHNLEHTVNVVRRSYEIIQNVKISEREKLIIIVAAWFHDTGQLFSETNGHEAKSVRLMQAFFLDNKIIDESLIAEIAECILATKMPVNPGNLKEEIICDADTYHLGTKEFIISDKKVRQEMETRGYIDKSDWDSSTLRFLLQHQFYTHYCNTLLDRGKKANIQLLKERMHSV